MNIVMWGREGGYGPDYPRNRVVMEALRALGHSTRLFKPKLSALADWEFRLRGEAKPDCLWVPCFRQRDVRAAARYARKMNIPLIFDPLISAWDKRVNERQKFPANSAAAKKLLHWEQRIFSLADVLIADTQGHAEFFRDVLAVPLEKQVVVPVGAEEALFFARPLAEKSANTPLEIAFFGTFIELQGVEVILEAIALYQGPRVRWRLLGEGPLRAACEARAAALCAADPGLDIAFENWRPLQDLPARLAEADLFLGIFGRGDKTRRVIPNKLYQSLAIGRPVITSATPAYPPALLADETQGLFWCAAGDAGDLARAFARAVSERQQLAALAKAARESYMRWFSAERVRLAVADALRQACQQQA